VLIVDDVPQNRIMLIDALTPLGFDTLDVENGQECLELLDGVRPDLIVMDVMMPLMDGWEATRRIRRQPALADIPVIIVTASATSDDEAKSYAAGANAFLPKPIEHELLLKAIGELLSLTWRYETSSPGPSVVQEATVDFEVPPHEELDKLYQLARMGNMQNICIHADYLTGLNPRYGAFARQLRQLAEGYQSKAIVALVERYRAEHKEAPAEAPAEKPEVTD
jgi:CheY-like chemotaxis protein